jgi:hypothetical protein
MAPRFQTSDGYTVVDEIERTDAATGHKRQYLRVSQNGAPAAATQARLAAARPNQRLTDGGGLRRMGGCTRRISRRDIRRDKS